MVLAGVLVQATDQARIAEQVEIVGQGHGVARVLQLPIIFV
jgi:hypothetical protein